MHRGSRYLGSLLLAAAFLAPAVNDWLCDPELSGLRPLSQRLSSLGRSRNGLLPSVGGRKSSRRSRLSQTEQG